MQDAFIEAVPHFFGLLNLFALRELIDTFDQPAGGDKSYAYFWCGVMLVTQAFDGMSRMWKLLTAVIIQATTWYARYWTDND